jgi:hypothetical protein
MGRFGQVFIAWTLGVAVAAVSGLPLFYPALARGRGIGAAVALASLCAAANFLLLHVPLGLAARDLLAGLGGGLRIAAAGLLGLPGFFLLLSRFESFDYGYGVLLQPSTWAFLLPFLLGGTAVLAFLSRDGESRPALAR